MSFVTDRAASQRRGQHPVLATPWAHAANGRSLPFKTLPLPAQIDSSDRFAELEPASCPSDPQSGNEARTVMQSPGRSLRYLFRVRGKKLA